MTRCLQKSQDLASIMKTQQEMCDDLNILLKCFDDDHGCEMEFYVSKLAFKSLLSLSMTVNCDNFFKDNFRLIFHFLGTWTDSWFWNANLHPKSDRWRWKGTWTNDKTNWTQYNHINHRSGASNWWFWTEFIRWNFAYIDLYIVCNPI